MNARLARHAALPRILAALLHHGTWLASALIAVGLAMLPFDPTGETQPPALLPGAFIVTAGIALLILLPIFRVALMLFFLLFERDYRLAAIAALVLAIIGLGFVLGMYMPD